MTDFKEITTQEEFDERIKERLSRAEKSIRKEYESYIAPEALEKLKATHSKEIEDLKASHTKEMEKYAGYDEKFTAQTAKIHELETSALKTKIAMSKKMPFEAIEFIQGDDEESITKSADKLCELSAPQRSTIVGFTRNTESPSDSDVDASYRALAQKFAKQER